MRAEEIAAKLREALGPKVVKLETPKPRRVFLTVREEDLEDAMKAVFDLSPEARFMTISAVDEGLDIELLYHVDLKGTVVTVRIKVPKEEMEVLDISHIAPAAEFIEREIRDLFGIEFVGLKPDKLYTPEGYDEKPLKKPMVGVLPPQARPVAEMLMESACSVTVSRAVMRKREDLGLPAMPPMVSAKPEAIEEIRNIAKEMGFTDRVGYDVEKRRLRYR
ncbi:hypothetical protein DRO33_04495 [Candidatus Bathyarchaeota archaeon]|nr:MAG: hypothetical protein DRO33_04495 [Candidatus Bathyarchaeota archaeon]